MRCKDWQDFEAKALSEQVFLQALGRQVRALRQERELTQAELAERAEVGMKYVGEIERGRTNPTVRLVWRLSQALGVEASDLFLFSVTDGEQDGALRAQLMRFLKGRQGKELERVAQILKLIVLE
jgi:transcriptional regulator with XRE-family HTH domain